MYIAYHVSVHACLTHKSDVNFHCNRLIRKRKVSQFTKRHTNSLLAQLNSKLIHKVHHVIPH